MEMPLFELLALIPNFKRELHKSGTGQQLTAVKICQKPVANSQQPGLHNPRN
jgi:hypothetical protein